MLALAAALGTGLIAAAVAVEARAGEPAAKEWAVVPEKSSVTLYATKQGSQIQGAFGEFTATIEFDPAKPESGHIGGVVKTGNVATGDDQNDTYVKSYLDVERFPEARFESKTIERIPDGFRATGELTLKGITNQAFLDFTFVSNDENTMPPAHATFEGVMWVNRFDYDIASDVDTSFAGRDVQVVVELALEH